MRSPYFNGSTQAPSPGVPIQLTAQTQPDDSSTVPAFSQAATDPHSQGPASSQRVTRKRSRKQTARQGLTQASQTKPAGSTQDPPPELVGGLLASASEDPRVSIWEPPPSPFSLVEEVLYQDPWRLLLACILLNRTTGRQVRSVLGAFFTRYPTAQSLSILTPDSDAMRGLEALVRPLGMYKRRAACLVRFSHEYLHTEWRDPRQLFGVGRYGYEAYLLFCRGAWHVMSPPQDKDLLRYYTWLHETGGEGQGLQRETLQTDVHVTIEQ